MKTADLIPDDSELTLFLQLQQAIQERNCPLHITHLQFHIGLPGPLLKGNEEIAQLFVGKVLETSEFHQNYCVNSKDLKKKDFPQPLAIQVMVLIVLTGLIFPILQLTKE